MEEYPFRGEEVLNSFPIRENSTVSKRDPRCTRTQQKHHLHIRSTVTQCLPNNFDKGRSFIARNAID